MHVDLLILNTSQLVTCDGEHPKHGPEMLNVGIIENGGIAISGEKIIEVGQSAEIEEKYTATQRLNASNKAICPGFVDPHTHVVYAGDRVDEFEMRIRGASYLEIMESGGGIASTTRKTRDASLNDLVEQSRERLDWMLELGTTTAEVKSGYGLDTETELKMLEAIAILDQTHAMDLIPTFMGAHAIPSEFQDDIEGYVSLVIDEMIPAVASWYRSSHFSAKNVPLFIDVFCEQNAFTAEQSRRILTAGREHGMYIKAHVDEFSSIGGVEMALGLNATSVDHLDVTTDEDIRKVAASKTIPIVIPAVNFNLGSSDFAPARELVGAGAALALTTDINPGSAPCPSMPLVMAIACRYQNLLPSEALTAATINAAYSIRQPEIGSLSAGKQADILILNTSDYRHIAYHLGNNHVETVIKRGQII